MPDTTLRNSLQFIQESLAMIQDRMRGIQRPEDFVGSSTGMLLLDGIAMRLQAISEKIKQIEKSSPGVFLSVGIDPQPIIRFRDFISHHYEEADYEILFDVCRNHLPFLEEKVQELLEKTS